MKSFIKSLISMPERLFLVVGVFFGIISIFLLPTLTAPDEGSHFRISYGMFSSNKNLPQDLFVSAEDSTKDASNGTYLNEIFEDKANLENDKFAFHFSREIGINSVSDTQSISSLDITHIPQAVGILAGRLTYPSIGVMTTLGRLVNLALYVAAIYFIIRWVRHGKLAFTFLATFPMMIHQAGSLSYDAINIVAIFAWVALMINLYTQKKPITKRQVVMVLVLGVMLLVTKPSNALLLGFLPFLPPTLYRQTKPGIILHRLFSSRFSRKTLLVISICIGILISIVGLYLTYKVLHSHGIGATRFMAVFFNTFFRPEVNPLLDPIVTSGVVGNFGWLWYRLPQWLVFLHMTIFFLILLGERGPRVPLRFALIALCTFILSIIGITLGMYFLWTLSPDIAGPGATFIQGMQGRYFTPLLILLIPVFTHLQQYIIIKLERKLLTYITLCMMIFSLTIYIILTYIFFYTSADGVKDALLM